MSERACESGSLVDATEVAAFADGDATLFAEVVQLFQDDSVRLLGELDTAIAAGDVRAAHRASHTLKGAVMVFGASPVADCAREIEMIAHDGRLDGADVRARELRDLVRTLNGELAGLVETL